MSEESMHVTLGKRKTIHLIASWDDVFLDDFITVCGRKGTLLNSDLACENEDEPIRWLPVTCDKCLHDHKATQLKDYEEPFVTVKNLKGEVIRYEDAKGRVIPNDLIK